MKKTVLTFSKRCRGKDKSLGLFLWLSFLLLLVGMFSPLMTFKTLLVFNNTVSLITGLIVLLKQHNYTIFLVIAIFSIVFPVSKIATLLYVWHFGDASSEKVHKILAWSEALGKWSMLDVFVIANIVVTVKLGIIAEVDVHYGLYIFALSILLALIASARMHKLSKTKHFLTNNSPQM